MPKWPDKSGSMRYRPEQLTIDNKQLQYSIDNCYCELFNLDKCIEKYAYALELIQPNAPGKIAIRFLKRPWGGLPGRHPQLIQWYTSRNNRWLYTRLRSNETLRKVKGYPVFAPVKEDVKTLLREAISMIQHREALLSAVNNFKRQLASMFTKNVSYMEDKENQINLWLPALLDKREILLAQRQQAVEAAQRDLPEDAVANPGTRPRVDHTSRTRGRIHQTRHKIR